MFHVGKYAQHVAFEMIKKVNALNGVGAIVSIEPVDLVALKASGCDAARVLVSQPDCPEQARDVAMALVKSGQVSVLYIVDAKRVCSDNVSFDRVLTTAARENDCMIITE